jgi:adenylate cyclase
MLCMPIVARGERKIGVMQILNRRGGPSARRRAPPARLLAQAAVAIENAQLFEEVRAERNYNEAILHSMNNAVLTLDAAGVVRKVNGRRCASCAAAPRSWSAANSTRSFPAATAGW